MPTDDAPLAGLRVLVTRPAEQAAGLVERIRRAGAEPIPFPTIAIVPVTPGALELDALAHCDTAIFVSPNAVAHGYPYLRDLERAPPRIIAVGRATRETLARHGCEGVHDPGEHASSEALLDQDVLQDVAGRHICVVRGRGGRELLRETLKERGARVDYLECYRRAVPADADTAGVERALDEHPETLVATVSSETGLSNLLAMLAEPQRQRLLDRPLVVIGARQRAAARARGWRGPLIAAEAGDAHILEAMVQWWRRKSPPAC